MRQTLTALLVDDEELLRGILRRELAAGGFEVVEAANGEQALHAARDCDGQLDVVVTDIRMPVMDGWEFARSFRLLYPSVPILFITGNDSAATLAPQSGAEENVLLKPFDSFELLDAVARTIDRGPLTGRTIA